MMSDLRSAAEVSSLSLARLLELCLKPSVELSEEELAELFKEVLEGPCTFDPELCAREGKPLVGHAHAQRDALPVRSLRDLLCSPSPPIELLHAAKEYAKACRMSPSSAVPGPIASAMYFLTVAMARRRGSLQSAAFSSMSEEELRAGVDWVLRQPWIDPGIKSLLS